MAYLKAHEDHVARDGWYRSSVRYESSPLGSVMIEECDAGCGQVAVHCEHQRNTWNADGTVLTCDLCGTDGT